MRYRYNPVEGILPAPTEPVYGTCDIRVDEVIARTVWSKFRFRVVPTIPPPKSADELPADKVRELADEEAWSGLNSEDERCIRFRNDKGTEEDIRSLAQDRLNRQHNEAVMDVVGDLGRIQNAVSVSRDGDLKCDSYIKNLVDQGLVKVQAARGQFGGLAHDKWYDLDEFSVDSTIDEQSGHSSRLNDARYSSDYSSITKNPYWKPAPPPPPVVGPEAKRPRRRKVTT